MFDLNTFFHQEIMTDMEKHETPFEELCIQEDVRIIPEIYASFY